MPKISSTSDLMTIKDLFELQARKTPGRVAIRYQGNHLTYDELNIQANRLAQIIRYRYYLKMGRLLTPDVLVGLCIEPSLEMVIAILAIIKSNAAYVPIDPEYPRKRVDAIVTDSKITLILTQKNLAHYFSNDLDFIFVEHELESSKLDANNLASTLSINDLAYVIYTSGSTGSPKGVMITHKAICNYIYWMSTFSSFHEAHIFDCPLSIAFDAVIQVLLFPLCAGLTVSICPYPVKIDPNSYLNYLQNEDITVTKMTPSYLVTLMNYLQRNGIKKNKLKILIVGGERFLLSDALKWNRWYPDCHILHHYGPTETTVGCLCHWVDFSNHYDRVLPLGQSGGNMDCYVVTDCQKLAKPGEIGELCISGYGLSRGYLNLGKLTEEKFVKNVFYSQSGFEKMYRTGDLVKLHSSKNLEYIGRIDHQVKLRGYRVECAEIEFHLKKFPEIQQCVVAIKQVNLLDCLVAYYTCVDDASIEIAVIKNYLKKVFPYYMIPSYFVELENFSLTVNGKIDRSGFPFPEAKNRFLL